MHTPEGVTFREAVEVYFKCMDDSRYPNFSNANSSERSKLLNRCTWQYMSQQCENLLEKIKQERNIRRMSVGGLTGEGHV